MGGPFSLEHVPGHRPFSDGVPTHRQMENVVKAGLHAARGHYCVEQRDSDDNISDNSTNSGTVGLRQASPDFLVLDVESAGQHCQYAPDPRAYTLRGGEVDRTALRSQLMGASAGTMHPDDRTH